MDIFEAGLLGILQGLTEFLPVSSSGHLVLVQHILGFRQSLLGFDVAVHIGTLAAVFVYYRKDLIVLLVKGLPALLKLPFVKNKEAYLDDHDEMRVILYLSTTFLATGMMVFIFRDFLEYMFTSPLGVGIAWIMMGAGLLRSRKFQNGKQSLATMNHRDAFFIGLIQGVAVIPGISRSGSTILAGMLNGLEKKEAAKYSFLSAIPAVLAAAVLEFESGYDFFLHYPVPMLVGVLISAIVGYLAIAFLLRIIQKGHLYLFGFYCSLIGVMAVMYSLILGV